jgi:16S rRNA (cytidine1402-2'-O)-methyltransferase
MVFYEAPHKLSATLSDMYAYFGDRKLAIVREITKIHEEVIRTTLAEASEKYKEESLKGEIVLVIEGYTESEEDIPTLEDAIEKAREYMQEGMSVSFAAKQAAKDTGIKKGDIYKALQEE